jgi:hypothetical protein
MGLPALVPYTVEPFRKLLLGSAPLDLVAWPHDVELGAVVKSIRIESKPLR